MTSLQTRPKHVPQRPCIACRRVKPKWELVRIVRNPQGAIEIDPRGKQAGRGAYLCRVQSCWEIGLKRKRLEHVLKAGIIPEQHSKLLEFSKTIPSGSKDTDTAFLEGKEAVDEAKSLAQ